MSRKRFFDQRHFDAARIDSFRKAEAARYTPDYFATEYWKEDLPGKSGNRGLSYDDPAHLQRFGLLWKGIEALSPSGTFLDVGCATGLLVEQALTNGRQASGVDMSEYAIEEFRRRTEGRWPDTIMRSDITALDMADGAFDTVLCFDVLEHLIVFDVFAAVAELCRVARKRIVASINLDNPYAFHPTILSRETWVALFEASAMARYNTEATSAIAAIVCPSRPEYDFFVFDRVAGRAAS